MDHHEQLVDDYEDPPSTEEQIAKLHEQRERSAIERRELYEAAQDGPSGSEEEERINGSVRDRQGRFAMPDDRAFLTDGRRGISNERMKRAAYKFEISLNRIKRSRSLIETVQGIPRLRGRLDELEREVVAYARSHGWSWRTIGRCLRLSHRTVHSRHAREMSKRRKHYGLYVRGEAAIVVPGGNPYAGGHPYTAADIFAAVDPYTFENPYLEDS